MRRYMIFVGSLVLFLGIAYAEKTHDGHEHAHKAPHGGHMLTVGNYHLEVVLQDHTLLQVYLYDAALQPLPLPTPEVTLYLRLPGNRQHTLTLQADGSGPEAAWSTQTELLREIHDFQGALRLTLDGDTKNIRFTYAADHRGSGHRHGGR